MAHCLRTSQLTKVYPGDAGDVTALNSVDLAVEPGEFVSVIGPSGSGKTTLLNMIGGLDMPTTGQVFVDEQDITALTEQQRSDIRLHRIGFVFQEFNLIPVLSAQENVEYVLLLKGAERSAAAMRAREMLKAVGLEGMESRRPNQLSGGQQQRVAVARAISTDPAIVLADEPTANLDSETGRRLIGMMQELNSTLGVTFLFSTHDPMVIESTQRVIQMRDGEIQES